MNGIGGTAPIELEVEPGATLPLDVRGSRDPDRGQRLRFRWFAYPEAGFRLGRGVAELAIRRPDDARPAIRATGACLPQWNPSGAPVPPAPPT